MRPWHGLLIVVLLTPTVQADPDPIAIHLEGEQGVHLTLRWTVDTGPLERLELYKFVDGELDVIPLDPTSDEYTEGGFEANVTAYWMGGVTVNGERIWSNVYDGPCYWVVRQDEAPYYRPQPSCLPPLPLVPDQAQHEAKKTASKVFPVDS